MEIPKNIAEKAAEYDMHFKELQRLKEEVREYFRTELKIEKLEMCSVCSAAEVPICMCEYKDGVYSRRSIFDWLEIYIPVAQYEGIYVKAMVDMPEV